MGSSSSGDKVIRYAPYLEEAHGQLLNHEGDDEPDVSVIDCFNAALGQSPYSQYTKIPVEDAFFGEGYGIVNFPSLYDMFGKFMGGMDVCDLWGQVYENVVHGPEIDAAVSAQSAMLEDEINTTILPKFLAGMRDINSVMGSSFIIGKAIIADSKVKAVNKFAADLRFHAIDTSVKIWLGHLEWNKAVVSYYSEYGKLYFSTRLDTDKTWLEYATKDILWDLNLFDYARSILGALSGAAAAQSEKEPGMLQKILGGALGGAGAGAAYGLPGAVIGAGLGLASAFF